MAAPRALYITFSILYLITLAVVLWFLLYYSGVPSWVWILFGVAILISIIGLVMSEVAIKKAVTPSGDVVPSRGLGVWAVLFILLQITAVVLIITGFAFVIQYSTIPWWVWVILGSAVLLIFIGGIMSALGVIVVGIIFAIIGYLAYIAGIILLVIYSNAPWWIWILIGVLILFGILSSVFEQMSERQKVVVNSRGCVTTTTATGTVTNCPVAVSQTVGSPAVNTTQLPTAAFPEQVIYN